MSFGLGRLNAKMLKGSFGHNLAALAGGTAIGQIIAILASPALTRIYSPENFGALAVYTSIIGIIGALATMSYHQAIPLPKGDDEAANVLAVSLLFTLVVFGLTSLIVSLGGSKVLKLIGASDLDPYLWMIPLGVLGLSSYEVVTQWALRQKEFSAIAQTSVSKGVVQTVTHLAMGLTGSGSIGLLLGQLLGQWTGAGSLVRKAVTENGPALRSVTISGMYAVALRYVRFPQFAAPSVFLNVVGVNAPPLILSYFFGGGVTGFYALGARVLMMPVGLVAKSASQVFVSSAPEFHRDGRLGVEVELLFGWMLRLGLTPVLILGMVAPVLFTIVFGDEWREAGVYMRWLSPWLLFVFVGFALSPLVSVLERQQAGMVFQTALTLSRIGTLVVAGMAGDALLAIALFGAVSGLCWAIYLVWLLGVGGASLAVSAVIFLKSVIASVPFAVPVAGCVLFKAPNVVVFGVAGVCCLAAFVWQVVAKR